MIPKHFHFIWLAGGRDLSELELISLRSKYRVYGDEYRYTLWTDDKNLLLGEEFRWLNINTNLHHVASKLDPGHPEYYNWVDPSQPHRLKSFESDYYRIKILNKYGGIYSDLDSISINKIPEVTDPAIDYVTTIENSPYSGGISGVFIGFFMTESDSPYLNKFLELRKSIPASLVSNMKLGLLCLSQYGVKLLDSKLLLPIGYTADQLELASMVMDIQDVKDSYELHCYSNSLIQNRILSAFTQRVKSMLNY